MNETLKIKYSSLCINTVLFYKIVDLLNQHALKNPTMSKEEKYFIIKEYQEIEPRLYEAMMEDIANGLL